ncbi:MAG: hypothetical protein ACRC2T_11885 [Thermoguttaceae bacterium]
MQENGASAEIEMGGEIEWLQVQKSKDYLSDYGVSSRKNGTC